MNDIPMRRDPIADTCEGPRLSRRGALLGLGAAFVLGGTRVAFAQTAGPNPDARLVVVLLRGGMDGLAAVPAYGDPDWVSLRGPLATPGPGRPDGALDLGGKFGLHPEMDGLHGLYRANELLIVHAVAGTHRSRSHFDAQDMLESGALQRLGSGWLNRALTAYPARRSGQYGLAVGLDVPLLMRGPATVQNYAPAGSSAVVNDDLMERIEALLARDPAFGPAVARGKAERQANNAVLSGEGRVAHRNALAPLAAAAGRLLAAPTGPRIAALEFGGWDTHVSQNLRISGNMDGLDGGLLALKQGLGDAWRHTAVLVVTEFGRTARPNGSAGTDHGTAGVAFVLGGAVAGGKVRADWPGLSDGKLFENRDLAQTTDVRAIAKGLLRDHLKLPMPAVEQAFPDSASVTPLNGLLRA